MSTRVTHLLQLFQKFQTAFPIGSIILSTHIFHKKIWYNEKNRSFRLFYILKGVIR